MNDLYGLFLDNRLWLSLLDDLDFDNNLLHGLRFFVNWLGFLNRLNLFLVFYRDLNRSRLWLFNLFNRGWFCGKARLACLISGSAASGDCSC